MSNDEKIKEKITKAIEDEGGELRYSFVVFVKDDKLKYLAIVNRGELHTVVGMLERAKNQLLKRMDDLEKGH